MNSLLEPIVQTHSINKKYLLNRHEKLIMPSEIKVQAYYHLVYGCLFPRVFVFFAFAICFCSLTFGIEGLTLMMEKPFVSIS